MAGFALLGAMLQGHHVMNMIGKGIVKEDLNLLAVLVALLCSGFFVTLATVFSIPTSSSQAIVGGVVGIGLAIGADVNYAKLITIGQSWIICPILVIALAYALSYLVSIILQLLGGGNVLLQHAFGWLAILSGCYVAYSMGANNVGDAVGPIANLGVIHPMILLAVGGTAIAVGAVTYGKKVADTVGKGIAPLDTPGAFVAQIASASGLHLFSMFGIPVSTSSAIVGAVVGVGLFKGARSISKKTIWTILIGWVMTPVSTALTSYGVYILINSLR